MMTGLEIAGLIGEPTTSSPNLEEVLAQARLNSLTRDNPKLADLPAWFQGLRDHQRVAIREILCAYEEGAECVILDAPTGSGKTLIGEVIRRVLPGRMQTTYICSSKALQGQFVRDYPYAKVLQGRSNYATVSYPERFGGKDGLSCADCTKTPGDAESCQWCPDVSGCPYERAKADALRSSLAVLNTSYYLSECNGPGRFSRGGLVVADEADTLESQLMGHVEVRISERRLKQYGLGTPRFITKEESWREWAEEAYEKVRKNPPAPRNGSSGLLDIREAKRHSFLVEKLKDLQEGLAVGGWVYTGDRSAIAFKPVSVDKLGQPKFWQHGDKFLLMSATVISADEMLESLGWDEDKEWRLVKCPSTFKPENRKVVVWPVANMTYKNKEEAEPKLLEAVRKIVDRHPDDRILVHSTSYALTRVLTEGLIMASGGGRDFAPVQTPSVQTASLQTTYLSDPYSFPDAQYLTQPPLTHRAIYSYSQASEKDGALEDFLATPASVLIAPSLDRGVDLPGDACRVQILCKVPFLNLKDKQVSARLYGGGREGKVWYVVNAIRTLVQMTGRAVRSEEDYAVSYLLDGQFVSNVWANHKRLVPAWWAEAIEWKMKGI